MSAPARIRAYRYGLRAETLCVWYLTLKGYRVLARRTRTPFGEIDLIARRRRTIVFIEVKARQNLDDGLFALHPMQQQRIINAGQAWLAKSPRYAQLDVRCDLMAVAGWRLRHVRNALERNE
jgi:putative endonuclease